MLFMLCRPVFRFIRAVVQATSALIVLAACAEATGCGHGTIGAPAIAVSSAHNAPSSDKGIVIGDTWEGFHSYQVFDGDITPAQARATASLFDFVWGTNKPGAWKAGNAIIATTWYMPFDGDGSIQHDLQWWKLHHPDWVLYECDRHTPARLDGLLNIPLDISNPSVVRWQMQTYGSIVERQAYGGFAFDLVNLTNSTKGCGVFIKGVWTQRFTGASQDPAWTQATLNWFHYAFNYLHQLPRPLFVAVNSVPENHPFMDPSMVDLIAHVDTIDDEQSFTRYGSGFVSDSNLQLIVQWMRYVQSVNRGWIVIDKWNLPSFDRQHLGWALASYLMGKYHSAALFVDHLPGYGREYYVPQYKALIGHPCGDMYRVAGAQNVYFRKYSGGLAIVNTSTSSVHSVSLPRPLYVDVFGQHVTSPMNVAPDWGYVLLTVNGCN